MQIYTAFPWNHLLATEPVESPALPLESVHHVHGSHGIPLGMLGVGHDVMDDILQEDLEKLRLLGTIQLMFDGWIEILP